MEVYFKGRVMFLQDDYRVREGLGRLRSWGARSQGSQFQIQRRPGHVITLVIMMAMMITMMMLGVKLW